MSKWPLHKNTQNNTKTRRTPRRNRHLETTIFVFFGLTIEKAHTRINLFLCLNMSRVGNALFTLALDYFILNVKHLNDSISP